MLFQLTLITGGGVQLPLSIDGLFSLGLLFVALSISVVQILKYPWLPARGGQTLVVLTGALLESSLIRGFYKAAQLNQLLGALPRALLSRN